MSYSGEYQTCMNGNIGIFHQITGWGKIKHNNVQYYGYFLNGKNNYSV
jgi:hypothetical protein